jgi:hypothetical protein
MQNTSRAHSYHISKAERARSTHRQQWLLLWERGARELRPARTPCCGPFSSLDQIHVLNAPLQLKTSGCRDKNRSFDQPHRRCRAGQDDDAINGMGGLTSK